MPLCENQMHFVSRLQSLESEKSFTGEKQILIKDTVPLENELTFHYRLDTFSPIETQHLLKLSL